MSNTPKAPPGGQSPAAEPDIGSRKRDHLQLCAEGDVGFRTRGTLLDELDLVHDALPELDLDELDLSVELFGKKLRAPLLIAAMTGGTSEAERVNRDLAAIADKRGYAFGLGSQRAMRKRPEALASYAVREVAPSVLLFGNIGVVQAMAMSNAEVLGLAHAVGADAICVHLNPAMEVVQAEGDRSFRGAKARLQDLALNLGLPVIAKETGSGLSTAAAEKLKAAGVRNVDVSGGGGTSWVGVEALRAKTDGDRSLGEMFWDWGVPTAASLLQVRPHRFDCVIATGGIRNGLDAAKAISLGAHLVGIARPVLQAWSKGGPPAAEAFLVNVERALRVAMLLTGSANVAALQKAQHVMRPALREWLP
jgi:isopentenyl-diphosphate Delta-isomerase